jgi:hypothetical protein
MGQYVVKSLSVDLVDNSASVCMTCSAGKQPTTINMKFPITVSAKQSEIELRNQTREKIRLVLTRALESMDEDE